MEKIKKAKSYDMLKHMSDYSIQQPMAIEKLCTELFLSHAYAPAIDLMVEAFLTVHSFALLMFQGLVSNASAILRILIEQVAAVTIISKNQKAFNEFLKFNSWKHNYYSSVGEEKTRIREFLINESGRKYKSESAIKDFLDYGWIRIINNSKSERSDRLIIKEARLEEFIIDINEQLNAFAHGQRSIFEFTKNRELADKHISRIIMIAGKLFLFLCHAKHELLVDDYLTNDQFFDSYLNAKILYLDLNARAIDDRIFNIIQTTEDIDKTIIYSMQTCDHMRGLIYQANLNYVQVNTIAKAYVLCLKNMSYMMFYKLFSKQVKDIFNGSECFKDVVMKIGINNIARYYVRSNQSLSLEELIKAIDQNDDLWMLMLSNGQPVEFRETFITDFTSFVHSMFDSLYLEAYEKELAESLISID